MSKTQIRTVAYWVKPSTPLYEQLPNHLVERVHQDFPGFTWRTFRPSLKGAIAVEVPRLRVTDQPRNHGSLWPSTPSVTELLVMSRSGKSSRMLDKSTVPTVPDSLTRGQVSRSARLASRIVSQQIVGIRAEMGVPDVFIRYFRYRHGFLILTVRHCLPIGLTRFLLGQWVKNPLSLWLIENCPFKYYLKRHTATEFLRDGLGSSDSGLTSLDSDGVGSPYSDTSSGSESAFETLLYRRIEAIRLYGPTLPKTM